jgi:cysteine desulfuration protein SufE
VTDIDDIADTFELLGDWEQRYQYLVELGEQLPPMPEELKTEDNKVKGCMSQVWVSAYADQADDDLIRFHGDCDTSIIKGVLALLIQLTSGRKVGDIEALDVDQFFERLSLDEHLSPNRHVGVYAIVELMKQQARRLHARKREVA